VDLGAVPAMATSRSVGAASTAAVDLPRTQVR